MSSTSFLNQLFVYFDIFTSFFSAVCTKPTLTQQSEASTTAVQMSTDRHESTPIPSQQLNYWTSLSFPYRLSVKRFLHQHPGCLCCLQKVAKFPVLRHLRYHYPTIPKHFCPQGVNRFSLGESCHFFGETCCLCRQGKCILPLRCRSEVPARTGILTPSAPQVVASRKVVNDTFAAIRTSHLNSNRPIQPLPTYAVVTFRNFGANLI